MPDVAVIIADSEIDLIQDWGSDARQHVRDLRAMGCVTRVKHFPSWPEAEAWADRYNNCEVD